MNNPLRYKAKTGRVLAAGKRRQELGHLRSIPFNMFPNFNPYDQLSTLVTEMREN
jgi:hypothetical protein